MSFLLRITCIFTAAAVLAGCGSLMNLIYRPTGWVVYDLTDRHVTPYTFSTGDVGLACNATQGLQPLVMAFSRIMSSPDQAGIVLNIMTGGCEAEIAHEENLTYIRELKAQNINEAKDARIREKRHYAIAATRLQQSYDFMVEAFGEPGEKCPKLNYEEGVYWALGNLAGLQAVYADLNAQSVVGVPKDIAQKAVRGLQCLDNQDYWGLPMAAQAGLWVLLPDTGPAGKDPWVEMATASRIGSDAGVRLADAAEVLIADSAGQTERLKAAIRRHADSLESHESDKEFRLLDVVATQQILAVSDRLWTEATGSRTPVGEFGTFWDDKSEEEDLGISLDDLLD